MSVVRVRPDRKISVWAGFGGAITEATAYNYSFLPPARKKAFLRAYFIDGGYTWGRVSIGSNDFCLAPYEYTAESSLEDFSIEHDRQYILPMLRDIFKVQTLNLIAAPWSPPSFMKSNRKLTHGGKLRRKYYGAYAKYLCLFLDAYRAAGFPIDFLSIQNEPEATQRWESCVWSLREQREFIYDYLLPELEAARSDTQILVWDHNREKLMKVAGELLTDKVAGLGFHSYNGTQAEQMRLVRGAYPRATLINTESCTAFEGSWQGAAEYYLRDVMACMNAGANAYLDWNLLLDQSGGPTWAENPVKAPILMNEERNDFVRTPLYNYIRVVAKAFPPGTRVVACESDDEDLVAVAGIYDGKARTVLMNTADSAKKFELWLGDFKVTGMMPPRTILKR